MYIEHTLARQIAKDKDFEKVLRLNRSVKDDVSLWVGAYQGYWFNQVLGRVLDQEIPISELEVGERDGELLIPLYFPGDEKSVEFYKRVCPEAIPQHVDPVVQELFLTNEGKRRGPRRPAFITVNDLEMDVHDGAIDFKFLLRSGAYATNFLSTLFDLDSEVLGTV
jgi:tRNA(Glu) U13 pseudouridine synthase TruD